MESPFALLFLLKNLQIPLLATASQGIPFLGMLLLALLVLSFSIAGNEVALFSLSKKDLDVLRTKQHAAAKRIVALLTAPKELYATLLIAGTFVNICIILLSNYLLIEVVRWEGVPDFLQGFLRVIIIVIAVFFITRILPKVWATQHNLRFAHDWSFVAMSLHSLLRSLSRWVVQLADRIGKTAGADRTQEMTLLELDEAIDIKSDEEASPEEKNIMKGVVKFGNIAVRQIMRSRIDVSGIELKTTLPELLKKVEELHYSRLPVYQESLDEIVGILNTKDLLPYVQATESVDWHSLVRPPYFVPEPKLIEDLLKEFQQKRIHFAVVVDEFGGTSGIVTMEDILEEVIGDIRDEFDEEETNGYKMDDRNYLVEGKTMLPDLCRILQLPLNTFDAVKGDSDSLAGLLLELAGELPVKDQLITCGDFEFRVLDIQQNRIQQVQVTITL